MQFDSLLAEKEMGPSGSCSLAMLGPRYCRRIEGQDGFQNFRLQSGGSPRQGARNTARTELLT